MKKTQPQDKRQINEAEFFALVEHISKQKNMTMEEVVNIMKAALEKSFHLNFDPDADLTIEINQDEKKFKVINNTMYVVDDTTVVDVTNNMFEIKLKDALKLDENAKVGELVSKEIDFSVFKNEIASQIGQLFKQELIKKHKEIIYDKYNTLKGEIVEAKVVSVLPQQVLFTIEDKAEASMPNFMRNNRQPLSPGQTIEVYVEDVRESGRGSQIVVSNGSTEIVKRFLEREIPEIEDGTIEAIVISRIPGFKSKIAIKSNNPNIDPIGSVVGPRGSRINAVTEHLFGERIDVIRWSGDINEFIANSISPAKAIGILDKNSEETTGGKIIIVPNKHQTLAIGKGGTNIKLASHLTKEKLDVISIDQAKEKNIKFTWNGNVSPEEVELIERGERIQFNRNQNRDKDTNSISSFDNDISTFAEDIADFDSSSELSKEDINYTQKRAKPKYRTNNYKTKDTETNTFSNSSPNMDDFQSETEISFDYEGEESFSDEDLKKMEEDFGFGDFDLNDLKDNEK